MLWAGLTGGSGVWGGRRLGWCRPWSQQGARSLLLYKGLLDAWPQAVVPSLL